jgi:GNAT superfamily N-acetyltransferase
MPPRHQDCGIDLDEVAHRVDARASGVTSSCVVLVAELGDRLVGVGRYERSTDSREAEVAFVVADEHQGRGIGTVLLDLANNMSPGRRTQAVSHSVVTYAAASVASAPITSAATR